MRESGNPTFQYSAKWDLPGPATRAADLLPIGDPGNPTPRAGATI
jgi:hypothetical protein